MNISKILKFLIEKNKLNTLELSRMTGIGQPVIYMSTAPIISIFFAILIKKIAKYAVLLAR